MLKKYNNNKGVALGYMLIMIMLILSISMAVLFTAHNNSRQSAFVEKYEQMYYTAESALTIADAIIANELNSIVPESGTGNSDVAAISDLLTTLDNNIRNLITFIKNEINKLYSNVYIDIDFNRLYDDDEIKNVITVSEVAPNEFISFFGNAVNGTSEVEAVTPFTITIKSTADGRAVEIERSFEISGVIFQEGSPSSGEGGGFWLAGGNLINSIVDWTQWTPINNPNGLNIQGLGNFDPPTMNFPSRNMSELMTPIPIGDEITNIRNKVRSILDDSSVYVINSWDITPLTITPSMLEEGGFNAISSETVPIILVGDFTSVGLRAVYGNQGVRLGNSVTSFSCDRSTSAEPLYIFGDSGGSSSVTFSSTSKVANAVMGANNTSAITGNSGDNYIYFDMQFYCANTITIDLIANNWDVTGVPSFITNNTMTVNVTAQNGFSGLMYAQNNSEFTINAPRINGAFLINGTSGKGITLKNTSPPPTPVELYFIINATAYNNLNQNLIDYFNALIHDSHGSGGGLIPERGDAEFNSEFRSIIRSSSTILEVPVATEP